MFNAKDVWVAWDKKLIYPSTNFRSINTNGDYKGQRDTEKNKDVFNNEEELVNILVSLGVKNIYPRIMEADDVISWLCSKLSKVIIVSSDNDLLQLINDNVSVYQPMKKIIIDNNNFESKVGVNKTCFLAYKAILGDSSDNIKGLNGYGKVKSKKLAQTYVNNGINDDNMLSIIQRNLMLMDLSKGYYMAGPDEEQSYISQYDNQQSIEPNMDMFKSLCQKHEFNKFLDQMNSWQSLFQTSRLVNILNKI